MWLYMGIYITYNLRKYNGGTYFEKPKLISLFKKKHFNYKNYQDVLQFAEWPNNEAPNSLE